MEFKKGNTATDFPVLLINFSTKTALFAWILGGVDEIITPSKLREIAEKSGIEGIKNYKGTVGTYRGATEMANKLLKDGYKVYEILA